MLSKIIVYNIMVLIHAMFEMGITPNFFDENIFFLLFGESLTSNKFLILLFFKIKKNSSAVFPSYPIE